MHTDYLDELILLIRKSEIYRKTERINDWNIAFEHVVSCFIRTREKRGKLFFVGNGGSAAIANHMTADFMKNGGMRTVNLYPAR